MQRSILIFLISIPLMLSRFAHAQAIDGRVLDEKKEPMILAAVSVFQKGIQKGSGITDIDGNYLIKPLVAGFYDVRVVYAGYGSVMMTDVLVDSNAVTTANFALRRSKGTLICGPIAIFCPPLLDKSYPTKKVLRRNEISQMPY